MLGCIKANSLYERQMPTPVKIALLDAALLLSVSGAGAQGVSDIVTGNSPNSSSSQAPLDEQICMSSRHTLEKVTLGRGRKHFEITLGGGACEPAGSGISDLWIRRSDDNDALDVVQASDCPAFKEQVAKIWAARPYSKETTQKYVSLGPFTFHGASYLFDLRNKIGQREAVKWLRQTFSLVEPCWNTIRNDRSRRVAPSLYRVLM